MDARRGPVASQTRTKTAIKADGKTSPPTGKVFNLTVCTVDDWEDGAMDKKFLFWDNQSYMTQIALGSTDRPISGSRTVALLDEAAVRSQLR